MKVCPVCKSRCFDDMKTCYGCLHNFDKSIEDNHNSSITDVMSDTEESSYDIWKHDDYQDSYHIPEYFEMESFPYIEETKQNPNIQKKIEFVIDTCGNQKYLLKMNITANVEKLVEI